MHQALTQVSMNQLIIKPEIQVVVSLLPFESLGNRTFEELGRGHVLAMFEPERVSVRQSLSQSTSGPRSWRTCDSLVDTFQK